MQKFLVIGLGTFGSTVARKLFESGADVVVIDKDKRRIEEIQSHVSAAIEIDCTDERSLADLSVEDKDAIVLAVGSNIEVSVLTTVILKKLGAINIHVKVNSQLHARILDMIGVKSIVFPEELVGSQLAHSLLSSNVIRFYDLSSAHSMVEIKAPENFIGKTLQELALPTQWGIHVIAIKSVSFAVTEDGRNVVDKSVNDMPGANDIVKDGDELSLLGPEAKITALLKASARANE